MPPLLPYSAEKQRHELPEQQDHQPPRRQASTAGQAVLCAAIVRLCRSRWMCSAVVGLAWRFGA